MADLHSMACCRDLKDLGRLLRKLWVPERASIAVPAKISLTVMYVDTLQYGWPYMCLSVHTYTFGVLGRVGESWFAIKDSLTHCSSSPGWASMCPLIIATYLFFHLSCLAYLCPICLGCLYLLP